MRYVFTLSLLFSLCSCNQLQAQSTVKSKTYPKSAKEYSDYGGKWGAGISIFGLGVPVRYYPNPRFALDAGPYLGVNAILSPDQSQIDELKISGVFGFGATAFGSPFFKDKTTKRATYRKLRKHGAVARVFYGPGDFRFTRYAAGWAMETIKEKDKMRAFTMELGLTYTDFNWKRTDVTPASDAAGLHFRLAWNFFVK